MHAVGMDELVRASVEFDDPGHPARAAARDYRAALRKRLRALAERIAPGEGAALAAALIEAARPPGAAAEGAGPADGGRRRG